MGSQTRRLRKDAGFTGYEYRRNLKRAARKRAIAAPFKFASDGETSLGIRAAPPAEVPATGMGPMTLDQVFETGGLPLAQEVEHPFGKTTIRGDGEPQPVTVVVDQGGNGNDLLAQRSHAPALRNEDDGITRTVGKTDKPREPGAARRLLPLLALLGMTAGLAIDPPKGER